MQSDGDFGRKLSISDQSADADATPGTTYYGAFAGYTVNGGFNSNMPAVPNKPVNLVADDLAKRTECPTPEIEHFRPYPMQVASDSP